MLGGSEESYIELMRKLRSFGGGVKWDVCNMEIRKIFRVIIENVINRFVIENGEGGELKIIKGLFRRILRVMMFLVIMGK